MPDGRSYLDLLIQSKRTVGRLAEEQVTETAVKELQKSQERKQKEEERIKDLTSRILVESALAGRAELPGGEEGITTEQLEGMLRGEAPAGTRIRPIRPEVKPVKPEKVPSTTEYFSAAGKFLSLANQATDETERKKLRANAESILLSGISLMEEKGAKIELSELKESFDPIIPGFAEGIQRRLGIVRKKKKVVKKERPTKKTKAVYPPPTTKRELTPEVQGLIDWIKEQQKSPSGQRHPKFGIIRKQAIDKGYSDYLR